MAPDTLLSKVVNRYAGYAALPTILKTQTSIWGSFLISTRKDQLKILI